MNFLDQAYDKGNDLESGNIWTLSSDGEIEAVKKLLSEGILVNVQDETGYSAL